MKRIFSLLLFLLAGLGARAQAGQDSLAVSVLTCSPGDKVYSLYGHTALRYQDAGRGLDLVFNYGVFSFEQPHFLWRFVLGKCDYMVMPLPWDLFVEDYRMRGSRITQQTLNLSPAEVRRIFSFLVENCSPENREYRYNYLYNNCTTKVRDAVEQLIDGRVDYPAQQEALSYRQHLHRYTAKYPWNQEGNDALLGAEVDEPIDEHEAMFLPENLMCSLRGATVTTASGVQRPLVKSEEIVLQEDPSKVPPSREWLPSPSMVGWSLLALALLLLLFELWRCRWIWGVDVVLLVLRGVAGTLIGFLFFFSEHPAVGSNWLLLLLNPLAFVGLYLVIKAAKKGSPTRWFAFDFVILALFFVISQLGLQEFGKLVVPLTLALATRPISYYLYRTKNVARK